MKSTPDEPARTGDESSTHAAGASLAGTALGAALLARAPWLTLDGDAVAAKLSTIGAAILDSDLAWQEAEIDLRWFIKPDEPGPINQSCADRIAQILRLDAGDVLAVLYLLAACGRLSRS